MVAALIVADLQRGITERFAFASAAVPAASAAVSAARRAGIPIVVVRAALRPDGADVGNRNTLFRTFLNIGDMLHEGATATDPDPGLGVRPNDIVVTKRRTSAFAGTELDLVLRAQEVDSIVLCGAATSAVVLATAYDAADRDIPVTILTDACGDPDPATHTFLTETLFSSRTFTVTTTFAWSASL